MLEDIVTGVRPTVTSERAAKAPSGFIELMRHCWISDPTIRPQFHEVLSKLQAMLDAQNGFAGAQHNCAAGTGSTKYDDGTSTKECKDTIRTFLINPCARPASQSEHVGRHAFFVAQIWGGAGSVFFAAVDAR